MMAGILESRRRIDNKSSRNMTSTISTSIMEQLLSYFVLLMGILVVFNIYHIFTISVVDMTSSMSSSIGDEQDQNHAIHQSQLRHHPQQHYHLPHWNKKDDTKTIIHKNSNNNNHKHPDEKGDGSGATRIQFPEYPLQRPKEDLVKDDAAYAAAAAAEEEELTSPGPTEENAAEENNDAEDAESSSSSTEESSSSSDDEDDNNEKNSNSKQQKQIQNGMEQEQNKKIIPTVRHDTAAAAAAAKITTKTKEKLKTKKKKRKLTEPHQLLIKKEKKETDKNTTTTNKIIDEHLLRILRHVGINQTSDITNEKDQQNLPTWEEVIGEVGNEGPIILGLDRCKDYNTNIVSNPYKRLMGVAGPFSSGTHYFHEILSKNCLFAPDPHKPQSGTTRRHNAILWQVPWGKHQSPRHRTTHNADSDRDDEKAGRISSTTSLSPSTLKYNKSILPIVTVRDPWTWMQSMCKTRYSAHWYHIVPDHCPNFIPNHIEHDWYNKTDKEVKKHYKRDPWKVDNVLNKANYTLDKQVVPLYVRYNSENSTHDSLVHMWKDWYQEYYDVTYPRLMLRLEDLVFYPHETLKQVCGCVGGDYVGDDNVVLNLDSAIAGSGHGIDNIHGKDRTGLLGAMAKHIHSHKTQGMTHDDYHFASQVLQDSEVRKYFKYHIPTYHS